MKAAKEKLLNQTQLHLLKILNESVRCRDSAKLKAALNEVTLALQEDIRQVDIDSDPELKAAIDKANDLLRVLAELEKMRAAVMTLKQPTISEIRSYSQPPTAIRSVMEATFILLGEENKKLKVRAMMSNRGL